MLNKIVLYLKRRQTLQYINIAIARAAATNCLRVIDLSNPASWEFSGFSQNGEDGIVNLLTSKIKNPNRYFVEIGALDGTENNTSWLALAMKYSGLMVEGNRKRFKDINSIIGPLNIGVDYLCLFVSKSNVSKLRERCLYENPDVFSLDIDGNDYYIADIILNGGIRPKIFIVEYNSTFGPDECLSIEYSDAFDYMKAHSSGLYYGASISAWKKLFHSFGYTFLTVETNGTNAFFINSIEFDDKFVKHIKGIDFKENFYHLRKFKYGWEKQFELIKGLNFIKV